MGRRENAHIHVDCASGTMVQAQPNILPVSYHKKGATSRLVAKKNTDPVFSVRTRFESRPFRIAQSRKFVPRGLERNKRFAPHSSELEMTENSENNDDFSRTEIRDSYFA